MLFACEALVREGKSIDFNLISISQVLSGLRNDLKYSGKRTNIGHLHYSLLGRVQ